jgi:signal peptidase II
VKQRLLPLILTGAVIAVDQLTKLLASRLLPLGRSVEVIGDFLRFSYVRNPGIAFSIGRNMEGPGRVIVALVLPLVVLAVLLYYLFRAPGITSGQRWLLAAVLGGGVGNYLDRLLRHGTVVDFVDFKFYGIFGLTRWPTFNLADATVVVAGITLLISFVTSEVRQRQ